ncbi:MAG: hypothetical protein HQL52_19385 [Magnetococcales bacterium]|nr:hypothetical protein [Magnetococcales bacterium]
MDGTVWAWGDNSYGQLGDGTTEDRFQPVQVSDFQDVKQIATGGSHSFAIKSDGNLWAWGRNDNGQLGNGLSENSAVPVQVLTLTNVNLVDAGGAHTVAITEDDIPWIWGSNQHGQIGFGERLIHPVVDQDNEGLLNLLGLDRDEDGMPDPFEERYGLDPDDPSDIDGDLDGDGFSNLDELKDFTDPTDSTSAADYWSPELEVSYPDNNSPLLVVQDPYGSAMDYGTGIAAVELQIKDGYGNYLKQEDGFQRWTTTDSWITASTDSDWSSWVLEFTDDDLWAVGEAYSITVKASDLTGNATETNRIFVYSYTGGQWQTEISLAMSSSSVFQGEEVTFSGRLNLAGSGGISLVQEIHLAVTDPNGSTLNYTTESDEDGFFTFSDVVPFNYDGHYEIVVSYNDENEGFLSSSSATETLWVGETAGYAVIVQGRIESDEEGQAAHQKTTDRIYQSLIDRGFEESHIWYVGYGNHPDEDSDILSPTKTTIEKLLTQTIPPLMDGTPAPLYLILVDHGEAEKFYLDSDETLSPTDIDGWLNSLEAELEEEALGKARVVVVGACYSGSFIPEVSGNNRIVVTSAADDEVSFKGPRENDEIRVGEYFLEELFKAWGRGVGLKEAFQTATEATEIYTQRSDWWIEIPPYFDNAIQHPLLDDDGDGIGSNVLNDLGGDGQLSTEHYLGAGLDYVINAPGNPAEILTTSGTIFLNANEDSDTLQLTVNDSARLDLSPWIEIRHPDQELPEQSGTEQVELELTKKFMKRDSEDGNDWYWYEEDYFEEAGRYEIYYFVQDQDTETLSPMERSVVYKNHADNHSPNDFSLLTPEDGASIRTTGVFQWEATTDDDPEDYVTYTLIIAKDDDFEVEVIRQEELTIPAAYVGPDDGLEDGMIYYWKVEALDGYGGRTVSEEVWHFETDNTNDRVGYVSGHVYDGESNELIYGATVTVQHVESGNSVETTALAPAAEFLLSQKPGEVTVTVQADGYETVVLTAEVLEDESLLELTIAMTTDLSVVVDRDGDGVSDSLDNCPDNANANQADADGDDIGDACDAASTVWIEEYDPMITYDGTWTPTTCSPCSGGRRIFSGQKGSLAVVKFNGTGIRWKGQKTPFGGKAKVCVDGICKGDVPFYFTPPIEFQSTLYEKENLEDGEHTLWIKVEGNQSHNNPVIDIDGFEVIK